ncbi:lipopolysaccharide biosynthesis protein [uncultured Gemmiger sp.]|uniref:lipopolysaccharide biosynthesis protein n=1 Tax=uncultured Gemmiger sp. TaxID=1623490 RepID=UPI0025E90A60|nr:lipopolysaccharide biosynthesis protein [uncultured Gemmiger sp.]
MESSKQKVAGGLFWSYGERIMAQLVSLIVSIVLARLLDPENYGVISIVMIFITFCDAIVTGGFGNAIVQKKDADELDVNTMLCCSVATSILLYIIIFCAAPYIAFFYNMPIIRPILRVLGLRLLISGVNSIQRAWIQKRMLFKRFFISTSFGTIVSAVVGISMAYMGKGAWALVGQYLTNSFIDTAVLLITNDWKPRLQFSWKRAKEMLSYGWKVLVTTVVYTIEGDLRSLIIGKKFGSADLAYYDQGKKFPNLLVTNINTSISNVMFPVLSESQNDPTRLKQLCRRAVRIGIYLLSPLLIGLMGVADTFVIAILSEKWAPCIPFLRILTLVFLVRPFTTTCQQSILSVGRSDITLKIEIIVNAVAIGILFYSVFILESVLGIAIGTLIAELVSMGMFMYYENRIIRYSYKEQLQDLLPSLGLATVMGVIVYIVHFLPIYKGLALILQVVIGAAFYFAASYVLQFEPFVYLVGMLKEKLNNPKMNWILSKLVR